MPSSLHTPLGNSMWKSDDPLRFPRNSVHVDTCSSCWNIKTTKMCGYSVAKMWGFLQFWPTLHRKYSFLDCFYEKLIVCGCSIHVSIRLLFDMHKICFLVRLGSKINWWTIDSSVEAFGIFKLFLYFVVIIFLFIALKFRIGMPMGSGDTELSVTSGCTKHSQSETTNIKWRYLPHTYSKAQQTFFDD